MEGFPGGSVVKNPTASAGDTSLISDLGRSRMPERNSAHAPQWLSLEPQLLRPMHPRACAQQKEMPTQCEARAPKLESSPYSLQLEKSLQSNEDSAQPKSK